MVCGGFTCLYFIKIDIFKRIFFSLALAHNPTLTATEQGELDWCLQQNHTVGVVGKEDPQEGQGEYSVTGRRKQPG